MPAVQTDDHTTTTTITETPDGVRFRFTVKASELAQAMRNLSAFAGTDDTLPVLTGVHVAVAGTEVTLMATDRYTLARQTLTVDANDVSGAGEVTLPKAIVKALAGASKTRDWEVVSLTVGDDDMVTVRHTDGATSAAQALCGDFPRCGKMLDDFEPATDVTEVESLPSVAFNAKYLARFAKIGRGQKTVTLTVAADSVYNYSGADKRSGRPVRWQCGDASGLICAIRIES